MKVGKWMKRMVILDLLALGLLFLARFERAETARQTASSNTRAVLAAGAPEENGFWDFAESMETEAAAADAAGRGNTAGRNMPGRIAITFDDGPHPRYTEKLLDGLAQRGVKATFFVTGANVEKYPEIIKRMQEEGHLIGNHTYHHVQLTAANEKQFREEIISTNEAIREVTGEDTAYIRPPYGSWNKKYEEELNMFPVLWTIDPRDWCSDDAACIVRNTIARIKDNDIILMHDQYKSSVDAALEIVDELQKEGYEFVTVEELLFD